MTGLFCFGLGYVAKNFIDKHPFWRCVGTKRAEQKKDELKDQYKTIIFNEFEKISASILDEYRYFLISIPPVEGKDIVLKFYRDYFIERQSSIRWIGYLSTTSVYGDHEGGWVDEVTPPTPLSKRGRERLSIEEEWLNLYRESNLPLHIFRLSSIYGPKNSALEKILYGKAALIDKTGHFFSRIHVADICNILQKTIDNPKPGEIFNLADDLPAEQASVLEYGYGLLGEDPPPRIPYDPKKIPTALKDYYAESKRVRNDKIKQELHISLMYPTYREGLQNCLESITNEQKKT